MSNFKIGVSAAASWAWGTSLILGMQIAQQKGMFIFALWALFNSLTLYAFGKYYHKIKTATEFKFFKLFMILIQIMCLIVNLNIINSLINNIILTSIIGIVFVLMVVKKGIQTSIKTDVWQYGTMCIGVFILIAMGIYQESYSGYNLSIDFSNIKWVAFSSTVLMLSPICDLQHYQRAKLSSKAYTYGALFFAGYVTLVGVASLFNVTSSMQIVLILTMLMATSSTIDSIAVALQGLTNKLVGTTISLVLCVAWTIFVDLGILELWNNFGVIRILFAIIIILTLWRNKKNGNSKNRIKQINRKS